MADRQAIIQLTEREQQVLRGLVEGKANKDIAAELGLSVSTVKYYVTRLCSKLEQPHRFALAMYALRERLLPPE